MNQIRLGSVFSGIGAIEQALLKTGVPFKIVFACDNGEIELKQSENDIRNEIKTINEKEINNFIKAKYKDTGKTNYVKKSYFANYDIGEDDWYDDIRFLDGKKYKGSIDLFVGGSPCQSFSIIGKRKGLEDTRGTLFYEYARLVKEIQPKVFIYENVPGMLTHDNGKTWIVISSVLKSLGYKLFVKVLNSMDYGIPQNRKRLFVIGFKDKTVNFVFPNKIVLSTSMFDYLENKVDARYYLGKKGFEFVTNPKYKNRARINNAIIQTEKANQQFNWNGDFVFEELSKLSNGNNILSRAYVGKYKNMDGVIRQLTHRECLRLMGFSDNFQIVVPNVQAYRQAGNSIVVNVLENLINSIMETNSL